MPRKTPVGLDHRVLERLLPLKASGTAYRVLTIFMRDMDEFGHVATTYQAIADELGVTVPAIAQAVPALREARAIAGTRIGRSPSTYVVLAALRDPVTGKVIGREGVKLER